MGYKVMVVKAITFVLFVLLTFTFAQDIKQQSNAIDKTGNEIIDKINDLWNETSQPEWQYLAKRKSGLDGELILHFKELCDNFETIRKPILSQTVLNSVWTWILIEEEINNINTLYKTFRTYQLKPDPIVYAESWENFTHIVLNGESEKTSAIKSLEILQDLIYDNDPQYKSIYASVKQASSKQRCDISQSTNQLVYNLYNLLQMIQLKAYTMIQFSWMLLKVYNKGNFSMESNLMKHSYMERISQQTMEVGIALASASTDLWKCDPKVHVEDETYTEITRFLQGFILNEVDMNSDNTCRENCAYYQYAKQYGCFKNQFCAKQAPCKGNIVGCTFVDSDMWVCQAPRWSKSRYEWIQYENGRVLGEKKSCSRVTKVDSWWRWLFWHCSYCLCYCDDHKDQLSNRYFNLREVTSDVEQNKIITGIRFVKSNGVIHIQIQEGELLSRCEVNSTTTSWKNVDNYNIQSSDVKLGTDYHMLTWLSRAIDLDDLMLPRNHILTGIKFRMLGGHLNLEIRGSEINCEDGQLKDSGKKSMWISNDNTDGAYRTPRTQLRLNKPDVPIKSSFGQSEPDSKHDQFIEFTSTDLDADVGQHAVPFIDTQQVAPYPPLPLIGAGIYHKGSSYSGGFIAPKVFTFNYSDLMLNYFQEINEANINNKK